MKLPGLVSLDPGPQKDNTLPLLPGWYLNSRRLASKDNTTTNLSP